MPMPKSVTKVTKDGVTFIDNVDAAKYTIRELIRAANRDVGKLLIKRAREKMPRKKGKARRGIQYWSRKGMGDEMPHLLIGILENMPAKGDKKNPGFYAMHYELGMGKTPKLAMISKATEESIDDIRKIQGRYLSAIADENRALGLIDEAEEISDE